jgi:hypothetical protein
MYEKYRMSQGMVVEFTTLNYANYSVIPVGCYICRTEELVVEEYAEQIFEHLQNS